MRIYNHFDGMKELKSVAYVAESNPFVESLIGKTRREYTDNLLFFGETDLAINCLLIKNILTRVASIVVSHLKRLKIMLKINLRMLSI